jgi:hypothetical protein
MAGMMETRLEVTRGLEDMPAGVIVDVRHGNSMPVNVGSRHAVTRRTPVDQIQSRVLALCKG